MKVVNIAHRGASGFAPENTIESIVKAAECGADAVEFDVQLSSDGIPVVFHDDYLNRCTNSEDIYPDRHPWCTSEFTLSELKNLDAGSWFVSGFEKSQLSDTSSVCKITSDEKQWITVSDLEHYVSGLVRIPTLSECLEKCLEHDLEAHIELKLVPRFWPDLTVKVVQEIKKLNLETRVVVSSFDHQALVDVKKLSPQTRTAVLTTSRIYRPDKYLKTLKAQAYNPSCHARHDSVGFGSHCNHLDTDTIKLLDDNNLEIYVWVSNDKKQMMSLIEAGVTGIFTDFPNRLYELINNAV